MQEVNKGTPVKVSKPRTQKVQEESAQSSSTVRQTKTQPAVLESVLQKELRNASKWKSTPKQKAQRMYALNTIVYKSNQEDAGMGLFMLERAEKGNRVTVYAGELITQKEADESDSEYILYIKNDTLLDAKNVLSRKGRYICHAGPGTTSNARISAIRRVVTDPISRKPCVSILATRTIKPGEEVLISYNKSWKWDWEAQKEAKPQRMQQRNRYCSGVRAKDTRHVAGEAKGEVEDEPKGVAEEAATGQRGGSDVIAAGI